jgi:3-oxoacyl-[acyl-carrier protein] reductase
MSMNYDFRGSNVCVTGASKGIGRAVAEAFARSGANIALLARSEAVMTVARDLSAYTSTIGIECDVSDWDSVRESIQKASSTIGKIDVLVNAAAILGPTGLSWDTDPGDWRQALDINLVGTYHTMRAVIPGMVELRRGKVINFAGGGAAYGYPMFSAYAASKVAVVRLSETVAQECAEYNVQVNAIAPGAIETDMLRAVRHAGGEVRTVCTMDEPVALVMFLASGSSSHVTGRFIHARDAYHDFLPEMNTESYKLRRLQP